MKRIESVLLLLVVGWSEQGILAAAPVNLPFDTYSGYFVSNKFEPNAAESFVVIPDQAHFDKTFGVAMVMGDKSHRLPQTPSNRTSSWPPSNGNAVWEFNVESVTETNGVVNSVTRQPRRRATPPRSPRR